MKDIRAPWAINLQPFRKNIKGVFLDLDLTQFALDLNLWKVLFKVLNTSE